VYREAAGGGDQPTVAEFTLDQIITVHSVHEQTRLAANLLHEYTCT